MGWKPDWMKYTPLGPLADVGESIYQTDLVKNDLLPMFGIGQTPEEAALTAQMQQTATDYQNYRPQIADARMQALQQGFEMMSPYTQAMEQMYGAGSTPDYSQVFNPLAAMHEQKPATPSLVSGQQPGPVRALSPEPSPARASARGR